MNTESKETLKLKRVTIKRKVKLRNQKPTSIQSLFEHLHKNGVRIKGEIVKTPDSQFFHCFDLYGNELICVELSK